MIYRLQRLVLWLLGIRFRVSPGRPVEMILPKYLSGRYADRLEADLYRRRGLRGRLVVRRAAPREDLW